MTGISNRLVLFGATGDLTYKKLLPSLFSLNTKGQGFDSIVAIGRKPFNNGSYQEYIRDKIVDKDTSDLEIDSFLKTVTYIEMSITAINDYRLLKAYNDDHPIDNNYFYYATSPSLFSAITKGIISIKDSFKEMNVIVEKPFGDNIKHASKLSKLMENTFGKEHVFRIDHYLGKEMITSVETLRFENPLFQETWNAKYIDHVNIKSIEEDGIFNRGSYYDQTGAIKDMIQNHMFQIMSLVAMEKAIGNNSDEVVKVLKKLRKPELLEDDSFVIGQYAEYTKEKGVKENSKTETYAKMKLYIESKRWKDVPFYIETGKKCSRKQMKIEIVYRQSNPNLQPNVLTINIQPEETVTFSFNVKKADDNNIFLTKMEFCNNCHEAFQINSRQAYERLLLAAIDHDQSMFSSFKEIYTSWKYVEEYVDHFKDKVELVIYPSGQDGPNNRIDPEI